jgi:hypothetical protein
LRNKILLRPIGIPDHAWEMHDKKSWHFVAVENDVVIGCVVLVPLILRNQNPINANGGRRTNKAKGIGKLLVNSIIVSSASPKPLKGRLSL